MQRSSVCLVQSNAAALGAGGRSGAFADEFLDQLLLRRPELGADPAWNREQRRREMMETFNTVLKHAANPQALAARLAALAVANEDRGIRRDHYEDGRRVLLELLREHNGPNWTRELLRAWEELLDHVMMHLSPPASIDEAMAA